MGRFPWMDSRLPRLEGSSELCVEGLGPDDPYFRKGGGGDD